MKKRKTLEEKRKVLIEMWDNKCAYCKNTSEVWELDHFTPLALGGADTESNLVLACPECNARKGYKPPLEFINKNKIEFTFKSYLKYIPPTSLKPISTSRSKRRHPEAFVDILNKLPENTSSFSYEGPAISVRKSNHFLKLIKKLPPNTQDFSFEGYKITFYKPPQEPMVAQTQPSQTTPKLIEFKPPAKLIEPKNPAKRSDVDFLNDAPRFFPSDLT